MPRNPTLVACTRCGRLFRTYPSRLKKGNGKFCSQACRRTRETRSCPTCGKSYTVEQNQLARGNGKFCSKRCAYDSFVKKVEKECPTCGHRFVAGGDGIPKRQVYCSKRCAGLAQRHGHEQTCQQCGKAFYTWPGHVARGNGKFCSQACHHANQKEQATINFVILACTHCGKELRRKPGTIKAGTPTFCSQRCHQRFRSVTKTDELICAHCGLPFAIKRSSIRGERGQFCSKSCASAARIYPSRRSPDRRSTREPHWQKARRMVWARDKGVCHVCQQGIVRADYHCGHIVDRRMGGTDDLDNLVVMCSRCNLTKPFHATREEYEAWRLDR